MNKFKNRKTIRAVEHTPFLKKIAACQLVSQSVCVCVNSKTKWVRETPKNLKKKHFFFINTSKIFTTRKILKMENKHPEHFWSA
jgi:3-hydroxyacyl-CoA dehydrogenase